MAKVKNEKLETSIDISRIFSLKERKYEANRLKQGHDLSSAFIKKLSSNEKRINMIIEKAIAENKNPKNKIIIFAGSLDSANYINKILKMENINCAIVTGETNPIERRNSIEMFKDTASGLNIIINFGVLTTGFDAPKSNVAIIGRPTQSVTLYSQMIGRVMRGKKAGGNEICKVVTVKDPIYGLEIWVKALNIGKNFGIKLIMSEKYEIFSAAFSANSLRATGFKSTHYALAELIDNSIQSALEDKKSKNCNVEVIAIDKGQKLSKILVVDDAGGMSPDILRTSLGVGRGRALEENKKNRVGKGKL